MFANYEEIQAFVAALPPITGPDSTYAGIDVAKLEACKNVGLIKLEEFKLAAAKVERATVKVAAVKAETVKSAWKTITPDSLPPTAAVHYKSMKEANQMAVDAKSQFETALAAHFGGRAVKVNVTKNGKKQKVAAIVGGKVPAGKALRLGYAYGDFSTSIIEWDGTIAAVSSGDTTLDDLFA